MGELILHVGMHKTGSSSIQNTLHATRRRHNWRYVDLGAPNASAAIITAFSETPERQNANRKAGLTRQELVPVARKIRYRLARLLQQAGAIRHPVILSREHIPLLREHELAAFLRFILERHGGPIRTVCYIRAPRAYMESVFQQHIQGGQSGFRLERQFPRYRQRYSRLERALQGARVEYWPFEPAAMPEGCVVRDFCRRLNLSIDPSEVQRANESLSLPAIRLLYAHRLYSRATDTGDASIDFTSLLAAALGELSGPRLRLHESATAALLDQNIEQIRWMERPLGSSLLDEPRRMGADAIRDEQQLLEFGPSELHWLENQLAGTDGRLHELSADPRAVAAAVETLRLKLARERRRGIRQMLLRVVRCFPWTPTARRSD